MEKYIYVAVFLLFIPIVFKILMALHIEHKFEKGAIWQIKCAYILGTILIAELLTQAVERIFSIF